MDVLVVCLQLLAAITGVTTLFGMLLNAPGSTEVRRGGGNRGGQ